MKLPWEILITQDGGDDGSDFIYPLELEEREEIVITRREGAAHIHIRHNMTSHRLQARQDARGRKTRTMTD